MICGIMDERRENRGGPIYWFVRRSRRFWIIAALLPVFYVLSFGPACWYADRHLICTKWNSMLGFYRPLTRTAWNNRECLSLLKEYGLWHSPANRYEDHSIVTYIMFYSDPLFD
jgi:hypothetical protein